MKYLQYLATSILAIIFLLSFQSCSDDDPMLATETITEVGLDTMVLENSFTYQTASGQKEDYRGVFFTCTETGDLYANVLVFGPDFEIVDGEPQATEDYFAQSWISEGPLSPGVYLTEGQFISSEPPTNPEPFFEVTITEANDFIVRGSFKSVNLDPGPWFVDVSGDFVLQNYDCAVLELDPGDIEDWSEYANGRAILTQDGNQEVVMAAAGFCEELLEEQQAPLGVIAFGGLIEVYDGRLDPGEGNLTDVLIIEEQQTHEINQAYEAIYFAAPINVEIVGKTWEEIKLLGTIVTVVYNDLGEKFITGKVYDRDDKVIADFNASTFTECG